MLNRVSTANAYQRSQNDLQRRASDLDRIQSQLTSGKRVDKASDDPSAAARAERAMVTVRRQTMEQRAIDASRTAMSNAESALGDGVDLLQSIRERLIQAGNVTYDASQRQYLANEIQGLRDQLLSVANQDDGSGNHVFGGSGSSTQPFLEDADGTVQWQIGPTANQTAPASETLPTSVNGQKIFMPSDSENLFATLDAAVATLSNASLSSADRTTALNTAVGGVDRGLSRLYTARAEAGEALNRADRVEARSQEIHNLAAADRSEAEDLDLTEGISRFTSQQTGYQAALQSYAKIQSLSLFTYIS